MTQLTPAQLYYLTCDLDQSQVSRRKQGSANLSYLEAWSVKAALIRLFGFGGFSSEAVDAKIIRAVEQPKSSGNGTNHKVTAQATVKLTIHQTGAVYQESAIADGILPDFTEAADAALKSAESDALKRAAIFLGTQFGLSLYKDGQTADVIGPVWSPDQIGKRDAYIREQEQAAAAVAQAQQGYQQQVQQAAQPVQAQQQAFQPQVQQAPQPQQQAPAQQQMTAEQARQQFVSPEVRHFGQVQQQMQQDRSAMMQRVQQGFKVDQAPGADTTDYVPGGEG